MQQHVDAVYTAAEERNLAAVSRMYQCWNSGDQGFIDEFISPNVVNHALPPGSPPGRDSFVWLYEVYRTAFADTSDEPEELLADGDKVIGRVRHRGRHVGEFFGVLATGRHVEYNSTYIWRLVDGRVVELWGDTDRLGLLRQLGAHVGLLEAA